MLYIYVYIELDKNKKSIQLVQFLTINFGSPHIRTNLTLSIYPYNPFKSPITCNSSSCSYSIVQIWRGFKITILIFFKLYEIKVIRFLKDIEELYETTVFFNRSNIRYIYPVSASTGFDFEIQQAIFIDILYRINILYNINYKEFISKVSSSIPF